MINKWVDISRNVTIFYDETFKFKTILPNESKEFKPVLDYIKQIELYNENVERLRLLNNQLREENEKLRLEYGIQKQIEPEGIFGEWSEF